MKKRNIFLSCIGAGLISLVGTFSLLHYNKEKPLEVRVGKIGYSHGLLISNDFTNCSAIILDFGNDALMAHVLPVESYDYYTLEGSTYYTSLDSDKHFVGYNTAIDELVEEAKKRNLDLKNSEAIVSFGRDFPRQHILKSILKKGIKVRKLDDSCADSYRSRSVIYYPKSDNLFVANSDTSKSKN